MTSQGRTPSPSSGATAVMRDDGGITAPRAAVGGRTLRGMATTSAAIDRARLLELIERERAALLARTTASQAAFERAVTVMPRGVPSSFQAADPRPIYLSHGEGSRVWDVDGNEYVDFHNGFGVMCVGHANPAIVRAVSERAAQGSHFAAPTDGSIVVAQELRRRFGLPQWRFTNSGTESTMDAIHLARGATGRDLVLKIEGSYHGHHDAVMVSVRPPLESSARATSRAASVRRRQAEGRDRPDEGDRLQRRGPPRARARRHRRPRRRADPRAGDDEHHDRLPEAGLPRARARAVDRHRHRPDLRRGQDRLHDRPRRRDRALRRPARHRLPGQGDLRRLPRRRDRHDRGRSPR